MIKTAYHRRILITVLFLAALSGCANRLFYYPDTKEIMTPLDSGLAYEDVTFESQDGTQLHGWFIPAREKAWATVIHFHGNAGNITSHFGIVSFLPRHGCNLMMFDYRGYGRSKGQPFRRGMYEDSMAALDYVLSRKDVDPESIMLLGQSLGAANAIAVASQAGDAVVRALVVDSGFYSYRTIVRDKIGGMPVLGWFKWPLSYIMATDSFHSGDLIETVSPIPVLILHGTNDRVIPYDHGLMLFERAREPKTFLTVDGGRHITALTVQGHIYRGKVIDFFKKALLSVDE